jgi:hypothetical protein
MYFAGHRRRATDGLLNQLSEVDPAKLLVALETLTASMQANPRHLVMPPDLP